MTRTPKPTDLLTTTDIAEMWGWPSRRAENVFHAVANENGGPIKVAGVRRLFIRRDWLDAQVRQAS